MPVSPRGGRHAHDPDIAAAVGNIFARVEPRPLDPPRAERCACRPERRRNLPRDARYWSAPAASGTKFWPHQHRAVLARQPVDHLAAPQVGVALILVVGLTQHLDVRAVGVDRDEARDGDDLARRIGEAEDAADQPLIGHPGAAAEPLGAAVGGGGLPRLARGQVDDEQPRPLPLRGRDIGDASAARRQRDALDAFARAEIVGRIRGRRRREAKEKYRREETLKHDDPPINIRFDSHDGGKMQGFAPFTAKVVLLPALLSRRLRSHLERLAQEGIAAAEHVGARRPNPRGHGRAPER